MSEEEINGLINQVKIMAVNTTEQKRQELLKIDSISFLHWLEEMRFYLEAYKVIPHTPQLVELADALLNVRIKFEGSKREEVYKDMCSFIKRINAFGDYGSIGAATL